MKKKVIFLNQGESGSISLLIVLIVIMAVSLSYGIVAVAETLIQKKEAMYGAQSSINSAAYVYGQTFIKKTRECLKEKITEELDETAVLDPSCDREKLNICLESDFKTCDLDLALCMPDKDELVQACIEDDRVIGASMDAAQTSAQQIASKYKLENLHLSLSGETFKIKAKKDLQTQLPMFGSIGKLDAQAESVLSIAKQEK